MKFYYNYYIDENGDYVEKPLGTNPWKSGFSKRGFNAVKKYRIQRKKREAFWQPLQNIIDFFVDR